MAHLYRQTKSSFWWISYRDPATGRTTRKSTGIRADSPGAKTRANAVLFEKLRGEAEIPRRRDSERWEHWVPAFFSERYAASPKTLLRAKACWAALFCYLNGEDRRPGHKPRTRIDVPRALTYRNAADYPAWRTEGGAGKRIHHNTAVVEMKFLGVIMREAVRRGLSPANPVREVELRRLPSQEKREISEEDEEVIMRELQNMPDWMRDHWTVLMKSGCRCDEAFVPLNRINWTDQTFTLRLKGGRMHTAPLHPVVLAIAERQRAAGCELLVERPPYAPKLWWQFFRKLKLDYSIHCTRVTVITRLLRKDWPVSKLLQLIGHTEEVNRVYRRLQASDARPLLSDL